MTDYEYGEMVEWKFLEETESTHRKPTPSHFVHHKFHIGCPSIEYGPTDSVTTLTKNLPFFYREVSMDPKDR